MIIYEYDTNDAFEGTKAGRLITFWWRELLHARSISTNGKNQLLVILYADNY